jgi:chemotaxis protein CheD
MEQNLPDLPRYFLRPGYIYVPAGPTLISAVLGSCVVVSLWDRKLEYGGMNHFLYPWINDPRRATARYGNIATKALFRLFAKTGSSPDNLEAQILGGATQAGNGQAREDIAEENIRIARQIMEQKGIPVVSQDVGGTKGRKVVYNSQTNENWVTNRRTVTPAKAEGQEALNSGIRASAGMTNAGFWIRDCVELYRDRGAHGPY